MSSYTSWLLQWVPSLTSGGASGARRGRALEAASGLGPRPLRSERGSALTATAAARLLPAAAPPAAPTALLPAPGAVACGQAWTNWSYPVTGSVPAVLDCGAFAILSIKYAYFGNPTGAERGPPRLERATRVRQR